MIRNQQMKRNIYKRLEGAGDSTLPTCGRQRAAPSHSLPQIGFGRRCAITPKTRSPVNLRRMLSAASRESAPGNSRIFCGSVLMRTAEDFPKQAPLLAPVDPADNGPQVSFGDARAVLQRDGLQKQDLFVNVRSEVEQLHDLCQRARVTRPKTRESA